MWRDNFTEEAIFDLNHTGKACDFARQERGGNHLSQKENIAVFSPMCERTCHFYERSVVLESPASKVGHVREDSYRADGRKVEARV